MWSYKDFKKETAVKDTSKQEELNKELLNKIEEITERLKEKDKQIEQLKKELEMKNKPVPIDSSYTYSAFGEAYTKEDSQPTTSSGNGCGIESYSGYNGSGYGQESRDIFDIIEDPGGWPDDIANFLGV